MATIITKNSSTASSVPLAGQLAQGELAVNVTDKKVYTKNASSEVVKLVGTLGNQDADNVNITGGTISGVSVSGSATVSVQRFSGDDSTTTFTLSTNPVSENNTQVFIGGVYQQKDTYSIIGTSLTFSEAPVAGTDNIEIVSTSMQGIGATSSDLVTFTQSGTGAVSTNVQAKLRQLLSIKDFGAVGDGVTNDTTAVQAFFNEVTSTGAQGYIPAGEYLLTSGVTINLSSKGFSIDGAGAESVIFRVKNTFSTSTPAITIEGGSSATYPTFEIGGFSIRSDAGSYGSCTTGLQVGNTGVVKPLSTGYNQRVIKGVFVAGFLTGIEVVHTRLVRFDNCSVWNNGLATANVCLKITQNATSGGGVHNTGDLVFDKCQFVTSTATGNKCLYMAGLGGPYNISNGNGSISGIKFRSCDFYAGDKAIHLYATAQSHITDIWFVDGCQIDQEVTNAVFVESNNASALIANLHFEGLYVNKATDYAMAFTSTGSYGFIRDVWVDGCVFYQPQTAAISFSGVDTVIQSVHVTDNVITDCSSTGGAIVFNEVNGITCTGNVARQDVFTSKPNYLVEFQTGCEEVVCTGNKGVVGTDVNVGVVLDNSGTTTGKTIHSNVGGVLFDDPTGSSEVGFIHSGTGAVARNVQEKMREFVSVKDFDVLGNGSDETSKIQNALNAAQGKRLIFEAGKVYGYTSLTIKEDTEVLTFGSVFNRLSSAVSPAGFIIEGGVNIDRLEITTPGGASGDRGIVISGSDVTIDFLSIIAASQSPYNVISYAVEVQDSGTAKRNIHINGGYIENFTAGLFLKHIQQCSVSNLEIVRYRTANYLRDASDCTFTNVLCRLTSSACTGSPGENGFLIERTDALKSCENLMFLGCTVEDSGEHAYRLGGQLTISNVRFTDCTAIRSGSAIVVNNPAATEWHGGCGFKVLGATTVVGQKHKNIFFDNCVVEDINETYGTFPTGHGAGNFAGFQIACASNVHVSNCSVRKNANTNYSCGYGFEILASDHVYLNNSVFDDMYQTARIYESGLVGAYPGWDLPCTDIHVSGCFFSTDNAGYSVAIGDNFQNFNHSNIHFIGCHIKGAARAVRIEPITGTGSYSNIYLDFTYTDCTANPASASEPVVYGSTSAMLNVRAPWHTAAYSPSGLDGSIWQDTVTGTIRKRSGGAWLDMSYAASIANVSVTTQTLTATTKAAVGGNLSNGKLQVQNGYSGFSRSATNWTPIAEISLLTGVATSTTSTEVITGSSDRTDRYASFDVYRGSSSARIGWNVKTSYDASPVTRVKFNPEGSLNFVPMTTPSVVAAGDVYYDSGTNKLRCYNGTTWNDLF